MGTTLENCTICYCSRVAAYLRGDNLVIDHPHSNGIWYDVGEANGIFVNNLIQGVGSVSRAFSYSTARMYRSTRIPL
jgi:hypothetical protein